MREINRQDPMYVACWANFNMEKFSVIENLNSELFDPDVGPNWLMSMANEGYGISAIKNILYNLRFSWEKFEGTFPLHLNAHRSVEEKNMVAYTLPTNGYPFYKTVRTKPGKFIKKHMSWLTDAEVQQMVEEFVIVNDGKYEFNQYLGNIPEGKCVKIYTNVDRESPTFYASHSNLPAVGGSCMCYKPGRYTEIGEKQHPVQAYEECEDVGIVWSEDEEGRTSSRALLNMKKKNSCRIYVSGKTIEDHLAIGAAIKKHMEDLGFNQEASFGLSGCKINAISSEISAGMYVMPYIDGVKGLTLLEDEDKFLIGSDGCAQAEQWEEGAISLEERFYCCHCDRSMYEGEEYRCCGESYCESCYLELFTRCDRCDDTIRCEDANSVDEDDCWCESCWNHHAYLCCRCGCYYSEVDEATDTNGSYCSECFSELNICEVCERAFANPLADINGRKMCESCAETEFPFECEDCGERHRTQEDVNSCCSRRAERTAEQESDGE